MRRVVAEKDRLEPAKHRCLEEKVAIVTGGGRGIGRAIAETLAKNGASVAVVARTRNEISETVRRIRSREGQAIAVSADISNEDEVRRVAETSQRRLGPPDVLVNNAGHIGVIAPLWESNPSEWWRNLEVNLRGPMLCSRAVLPSMISRKQGVIVNIGSYIGIRAYPENIAYSTSKCALVRFTDGLAASVAKYGIGVFLLSPGMVKTQMVREIPRDILGNESDIVWSPPKAAANIVLRLACGEGRALTGRFLHVDDDFDELVRNSRRIRNKNLYTLRLLKLRGPED
jgi:NAD(P)-dependent dehydrogenase (short-subunit alcohol dehydrogenase family)